MVTDIKQDFEAQQETEHQLRFNGLPYVSDFPDCDAVIFDGDCRFCLKSVRQLLWFDRAKRLTFVSLHDPYVAEHFPHLSFDQMMEQIFVIDRSSNERNSDQAYGGASAIRYLSRRLPMLWPAAPFLHIPFTLPIWQSLYRWVANRRYRIAGKTNDSQCEGSCSLHFDRDS